MDYKEKYEDLLAEIEKSELEFGQKRAQFRQLYLDCENKLKDQKDITKQHEQKISELTQQLDVYKVENEGVQTAARLSLESYNEDMIALKRKHQEQLSSLQHIWEVSSQERINLIAKQFEDDKTKLIQVNNKLEQRLKELKGDSQDDSSKDGLISLMSNAFSRKSLETKSSSLEIKQHQAQADIDAWKSIVGPLEEEIAMLKKQLKEESRNRLDRNDLEDEALKEKLIDTKKYLDSERSARVDLEMYVAVLNTQKGVLQEDADKLKRELHSVCHLLEQEKSNHKELKETWTLANEQFITTHSAMQQEIELMRKVLTSQQLEQVSKSLRNNRSIFKPINFLKSEKQKSIESLISFDKEKLSPQLLKRKSPAVANKMKTSISGRIFDSLFPAAKELNDLINKDKEKNRNPNSSSLLSSDDDDDDIEQAILKQNVDRYNIEKAEEEFGVETSIIEPEKSFLGLKKSSSHGDIINVESSSQEFFAQEKSLSQGDVSWIKNQSEESLSIQSRNEESWSTQESWSNQDSTMTDEIESKNSIDKKWIEDMSQLHQCMMCQNYEKQLQRLQAEFMSVKEKEERLEVGLKTFEAELDSEREKFNSLKKSTESAAADTNSQISIYKTNQVEVDKQVQLLFTQFYQFQNDIIHEMKILAEERDRCLAETTSLKEHGHNKCGSHEDLNENQEINEQLRTEIMFLKDRLMAEHIDRETTEKSIKHDLHMAQKQIATFKRKNPALLQEEHSRSEDNAHQQDYPRSHDHESQ